MTREPVVIANSVAALISAVIVALVALGYLPWDEVQQAAVMGVVVAAVNIVAAMWTRPQVTPLNSPRDADGQPLARLDGSPAIKARGPASR